MGFFQLTPTISVAQVTRLNAPSMVCRLSCEVSPIKPVPRLATSRFAIAHCVSAVSKALFSQRLVNTRESHVSKVVCFGGRAVKPALGRVGGQACYHP